MSIASENEERHGLPANADSGWSYIVCIYTADSDLRVRYAAILTLRLIAGLSFEAIAKQIGLETSGGVHRLYQRAIQDFRDWSGQPRFRREELKAILAGEAIPYPASAKLRELAERVTPI